MLTTYQQQARTKLVLTVVAILVVAGVVVFADHLKSSQNKKAAATHTTNTATTSTNTNTDTNNASTDTATSSSSLTDGTYTASSDYAVPPGTESITVTATLSGGVVTDISVQHSENDRESAEFQQEFTQDYKSLVIGKSISSLHLTNIAGASDTTEGFNKAIAQIEAKAQA